MTFFLSYSPRNYSHFLKDIEKTIGQRFNVIQGMVWGKGSVEGNQIHKSRKVQVESSGTSSNQEVKSTGHMVLCSVGQQKCKKALS